MCIKAKVIPYCYKLRIGLFLCVLGIACAFVAPSTTEDDGARQFFACYKAW